MRHGEKSAAIASVTKASASTGESVTAFLSLRNCLQCGHCGFGACGRYQEVAGGHHPWAGVSKRQAQYGQVYFPVVQDGSAYSMAQRGQIASALGSSAPQPTQWGTAVFVSSFTGTPS